MSPAETETEVEQLKNRISQLEGQVSDMLAAMLAILSDVSPVAAAAIKKALGSARA